MADSSTDTLFQFTIPDKRPADTPQLRFTVNDEPFTLLMPKLTVAVGLLNIMEREETLGRVEYGIQLAQSMWGLLDYVTKERPVPDMMPNPAWTAESSDDVPEVLPNPNGGKLRGRARLLQRLRDPDDAMDVDDLAPLLARMLAVMFNRPTTSLPDSSGQPDSDGSTSKASSSEPLAEASST